MKWQTGVIMEIKGRNAILLTPSGTFSKVKLRGTIPGIGEEVRVPVHNRFNINLPVRSWVAVAAAILMFTIATPLISLLNKTPEVAVAYVSIDINPSMELTISNYNNVLAAQPYNKDGEKVLAGLDLKGLDIKKAVQLISNKAKSLGFIKNVNKHSIILSVAYLPGANKNINEGAILALANDALGESLGAQAVQNTVQTIKLSSEIRDTANKKGISPAKYALLIEAVNSGLSLTEKDIKNNSIEVAISSAGGEPEKIIDQAHKESSFDKKEEMYYAILSRNNRSTAEQSEENMPNKPGNVEPSVPIKKSDNKADESKDTTNNQNEPAKNDTKTSGNSVKPASGDVDKTPVDTRTDNETRTNDINRQENDNTSDNYMSSDDDKSVNEDSTKLKPNF